MPRLARMAALTGGLELLLVLLGLLISVATAQNTRQQPEAELIEPVSNNESLFNILEQVMGRMNLSSEFITSATGLTTTPVPGSNQKRSVEFGDWPGESDQQNWPNASQPNIESASHQAARYEDAHDEEADRRFHYDRPSEIPSDGASSSFHLTAGLLVRPTEETPDNHTLANNQTIEETSEPRARSLRNQPPAAAGNKLLAISRPPYATGDREAQLEAKSSTQAPADQTALQTSKQQNDAASAPSPLAYGAERLANSLAHISSSLLTNDLGPESDRRIDKLSPSDSFLNLSPLPATSGQISGDLAGSWPSLATKRLTNDRYVEPGQEQLLPARGLPESALKPSPGSAGSFSAALVNISGPLTAPLSASEAMEGSMGSSTIGVTSTSGRTAAPEQPTSATNKPTTAKRQSQHFTNSLGGLGWLSAGSYSMPANQLNDLGSLDSATSGRSQASYHRPSVEPTGAPSAGRYGLTPSLLEASHQASGFRSPASQIGGPAAMLPPTYLSSAPLGSPSLAASSSTVSEPTRPPTSSPGTSIASISSAMGSVQTAVSNSTTAPPTGPALASSIAQAQAQEQQAAANAGARRVFNLTRVEHISAECSNDLIRTVIVFNGTFKGIIYSSGYVRDPSCLYVNGTGKNRYEFTIRLNQCGTLNRQEMRSPAQGTELSRRDHVMWNTLTIQYNSIIEQEWDEHFRVSCEYGSDFWRTISFSPFQVETNTGAPVVFTVDPPQCQMEILKGHGMVGPRQSAVSGPVTVGDPLTLLIHMKSEKAGYDILVKNCLAHNGGQHKMQLIDSNGCVVNERFISPFRGMYDDNNLKHVTLYAYLKAFRFTGSPVLYLECEVHMCQSACPPQMCYWRRLSKRSTDSELLLDHDDEFKLNTSIPELPLGRHRQARARILDGGDDVEVTARTIAATTTTTGKPRPLEDRVSLYSSLVVQQPREQGSDETQSPDDPYALPMESSATQIEGRHIRRSTGDQQLLCYQQTDVLIFVLIVVASLLVALVVSACCCLRATSLTRLTRFRRLQASPNGSHGQLKLATNPLVGAPLPHQFHCPSPPYGKLTGPRLDPANDPMLMMSFSSPTISLNSPRSGHHQASSESPLAHQHTRRPHLSVQQLH